VLTLVATPIGNIADITLRAIDALMRADVLLCEDTRVTKKLLNILETRYNKIPLNPQQFIPLHSHNEQAFLDNLSPDFFQQNILYVSDAGMPSVSDPGALLVEYCIEQNIEYDVLPGANAYLLAYVASGFKDTKTLFIGFLPHKGSQRAVALQEALYSGYVTMLYESPRRLIRLLEEINETEPDRELFVAKELTKKFQTYYKGSASKIMKDIGAQVRGEWVVVLNAAQSRVSSTISKQEIMALNLPKKSTAKLLSKLSGRSVKSCYDELVDL